MNKALGMLVRGPVAIFPTSARPDVSGLRAVGVPKSRHPSLATSLTKKKGVFMNREKIRSPEEEFLEKADDYHKALDRGDFKEADAIKEERKRLLEKVDKEEAA